MNPTIKSHRGPKALTTGIGALLLTLASVHVASAQTNNTRTGLNAGVFFNTSTGDDNTADGSDALRFNSTGIRNTAVGSQALRFNAVGNNNTAIGFGTLTANTVNNNTAVGYSALYQNTTGTNNTAVGVNALFSNTTGVNNAAFGHYTMFTNTTGGLNTAFGIQALRFNVSGASNTALGFQALLKNTTGGFNVAIGDGALQNSTTGSGNIGIGEDGGFNLTVGSNNICIGNTGVAGEAGKIRIGTEGTHTDTFLTGVIHGDGSGLTGVIVPAVQVTGTLTTTQIADAAVTSAKLAPNLSLSGDLTLPATSVTDGAILAGGSTLLHSFGTENLFVGFGAGNRTMSGAANTASGYGALASNTTGNNNTASGFNALFYNTTGYSNTASGLYALRFNTTGNNNTASGIGALEFNTTGSNNIALGYLAGYALTSGDNNIAIGNTGVAGESGIIRIGTAGTHTKTLLAGNVGIGTTSPGVNLDVVGSVNVTMFEQNTPILGDRRGIDFGTTNGWRSIADYSLPTTFFNSDVSIRADKWIASGYGFVAYSDRRIKRDLQASVTAKDLAAIQQLRVTDYRMVDPADGGGGVRKGFIAQEVEEVIPGAVTQSVEFVPDIFSVATSVVFDPAAKTLALTLPKLHGLKAGDRVRLHMDGKRVDLNVSAVPFAREFVVEKCESAPEKVLVYGKQVNDFRTVDYDRIFTTAVGALQELKKEKDAEVKALQEENAALRARLDAQDRRLAAMESRDPRLVRGGKAPGKRPARVSNATLSLR